MSMTRVDGQSWSVEKLRMATTAAGCALWSWNVETDEIALDDRARALWWVADEETVTFEDLSRRIHPEDLDRVKESFEATRGVPGPYEIDFRIRRDEEVRWISARGQGDDAGIVDDTLFAVFMDVTQRKSAEEARELLAGEMSHRVKNLFAVASALTTIAARSAANPEDMARDITQRLAALGQAHDLTRLSAGQDAKGVKLGELLAVLLAPFGHMGGSGSRIRIDAPDARVGEASSTTLALVIHELATNSIKHGALSAAGGTLEIVGEAAGPASIVLTWREHGGPEIGGPPASRGFGGKLVNRSVSGQLGGTAEFDWQRSGLVVTLTLGKAQLGT